MFRRSNIFKNVRPPRGSYLYHLYEKTGLLGGFDWEYRVLVPGNPILKNGELSESSSMSNAGIYEEQPLFLDSLEAVEIEIP